MATKSESSYVVFVDFLRWVLRGWEIWGSTVLGSPLVRRKMGELRSGWNRDWEGTRVWVSGGPRCRSDLEESPGSAGPLLSQGASQT